MTDHVARNRAVWDRLSVEYAEGGRRGWAETEPTWGIWHLPEREVRALPEVADRDSRVAMLLQEERAGVEIKVPAAALKEVLDKDKK